MPCLCEFYHGICLTTEEQARKNLSQGSQRMPVGMMQIEYTKQNLITIRIQEHNKHLSGRAAEENHESLNVAGDIVALHNHIIFITDGNDGISECIHDSFNSWFAPNNTTQHCVYSSSHVKT